MTPEAQRIAIAEACGQADRFVLIKRGYYYRPNGHGYTNCLSEAWIMTEAEADKHVYPHDEPVIKQRAPVPDYLDDLNAIHKAEKVLSQGEKTQYIFQLQTLCGGQKFGDNYFATAAQRAEAFLKTIGKWTQ